ncbi:MAG: MotA/TolQ/ExbB proton channel family protein [Pseudomonadota bacterium]
MVFALAGAEPDYSIVGMVMNADPVVQAVMAGLVLASVACWAIILEKTIRLSGLRGSAREVERIAETGAFSGQERSRLAKGIKAAAIEEATEGGAPGEDANDTRARLERAMRGAVKGELRGAETGLPFLATVGSAAPFVGLFGTVWGIMNSFTSIALSKDTSLAVVAPGIAEALFATALGLAAAIPAVIAYNQFAVGLGKISERMGLAIPRLAKRLAKTPPAAMGGAHSPQSVRGEAA